MQYLINSSEEQCHRNTINALLEEPVCFDCMVAFAKTSGFRMIKEALIKALQRNNNNPQARFRFIVGLDFYQTEPHLLYEILKLSKNYPSLSLFLHNEGRVFHPKVYAFQTINGENHIAIGSANLTSGGLLNNNESSLLVKSTNMRTTILNQIEGLIKNNQIIKATKKNISEYEEKYNIYNVRKIFFEKKTKNAMQNPVKGDFETLEAILDLMKQQGRFEPDVKRRIASRKKAIGQLKLLANQRNINVNSFLQLYEPLVQGSDHYWHSGGLARNKNKIARSAELFQSKLKTVKKLNNPTPQEAYSTLQGIDGAKRNTISEILHTIDNKKFAVMNKNSIAGMKRANYSFPNTVTSAVYQDFCDKAQAVCEALGLNNFTELDALLNYAYWNVNE